MSGDRNYHEINDSQNKEIVQQLITDCADPDIATVLRCCVIGQNEVDIRKEIIKLKVPILKSTAVYLGNIMVTYQ